MEIQALIPVLLITAFVALGLGLGWLAWQAEKKRLAALALTAERLGLRFNPARDRELARHHEDLRGLAEGGDRFAFNVLTGETAGHPVTLFDFHYETKSTNSKGHTSTTSHYRHVVLLHLKRSFPGLSISPEGLFSKIAQAVGYDDIDFESHEFSRRYCVRGPDKRFAYDFCNSGMIQFLLDHANLILQLHGDLLAFVREDRLDPARIESELAVATAIRERMPAYLFAA